MSWLKQAVLILAIVTYASCKIIKILDQNYQMETVYTFSNENGPPFHINIERSKILVFMNRTSYILKNDFTNMKLNRFKDRPKGGVKNGFRDADSNSLKLSRGKLIFETRQLKSYEVDLDGNKKVLNIQGNTRAHRAFILLASSEEDHTGKVYAMRTDQSIRPDNSAIILDQIPEIGDKITAIAVNDKNGQILLSEIAISENSQFNMILLEETNAPAPPAEIITPTVPIKEITTPIVPKEEIITPTAPPTEIKTPIVLPAEITTPIVPTEEITTPIVPIEEITTPIVTKEEIITPIVPIVEIITPIVPTVEIITPIVPTEEITTPIVTKEEITTPIVSTVEIISPIVPPNVVNMSEQMVGEIPTSKPNTINIYEIDRNEFKNKVAIIKDKLLENYENKYNMSLNSIQKENQRLRNSNKCKNPLSLIGQLLGLDTSQMLDRENVINDKITECLERINNVYADHILQIAKSRPEMYKCARLKMMKIKIQNLKKQLKRMIPRDGSKPVLNVKLSVTEALYLHYGDINRDKYMCGLKENVTVLLNRYNAFEYLIA